MTSLRRLDDGSASDARSFVEGLRLRDDVAERPRVVACMIASADGRAAITGKSVALGHPSDRALLRELRTAVDAILVGTRTLAAEGYARLLDPEQREHRVASGRASHPLVCTISRRLAVPDVPVLHEDGTPVVVFTEADGGAHAGLEVVRLTPLTIAGVVGAIAARGASAVLCEGGPALLREIVACGALDDLFLTISPVLAAGDAPTILAGDVLPDPQRLALRAVHRADDHLFLHYGLVS